MFHRYAPGALAVTLSLLGGTGAIAAPYRYSITSALQTDVEVTPILTQDSIAVFYNYENWSARPTFDLVEKEALFFLHQDATTGSLALGVILDARNNTGGGTADFTLSGSPASAVMAVRDDPGDTPTVPNADYSFSWGTCCTDGFAAEGYEEASWLVRFSNMVLTGITDARFFNGDGSKIDLGDLSQSGLVIEAQDLSIIPLPAGLPLGLGALGALALLRRRG